MATVFRSGMVYLIQPFENLGSNRFKIGMSAKSTLSRIKSYGSKCGIISTRECVNPLDVEKELISEFNNRFHLYRGREWFSGNKIDMISVFDDVIKRCAKYESIEELELDSEPELSPESVEDNDNLVDITEFNSAIKFLLHIYYDLVNTYNRIVFEIHSDDLYGSYTKYCSMNNVNAMSQRTFEINTKPLLNTKRYENTTYKVYSINILQTSLKYCLPQPSNKSIVCCTSTMMFMMHLYQYLVEKNDFTEQRNQTSVDIYNLFIKYCDHNNYIRKSKRVFDIESKSYFKGVHIDGIKYNFYSIHILNKTLAEFLPRTIAVDTKNELPDYIRFFVDILNDLNARNDNSLYSIKSIDLFFQYKKTSDDVISSVVFDRYVNTICKTFRTNDTVYKQYNRELLQTGLAIYLQASNP